MTRPNTHHNGVALSDVAEIVRRVIELTFKDDPGCGHLLGELLAFLWKARSDLAEANYYFQREFSKPESARPASRKRSALRRLIQTIIDDATAATVYFLCTGKRLRFKTVPFICNCAHCQSFRQ